MIPTQLHPYIGILRLDDSQSRAFLVQRNSAGEPVTTLMTIDNPPSGEFDQNGIPAAWRFFRSKPGVADGSTITVYGFWGYPPNGDIPLLHIVRA